MSDRVARSGLSVEAVLDAYVGKELLPPIGMPVQRFWDAAAVLIARFAPQIRAVLTRRDELQAQLDDWYRARETAPDATETAHFLSDIGYLVAAPTKFTISTTGVDDEVARIAGPQLVVPLDNARFAINAANARWGSLYDALYGTDAIWRDGDLAPDDRYNPRRGAAVVEWSKRLLDDAVPLRAGSHAQAIRYRVADGELSIVRPEDTVGLADPGQFVGYTGDPASPASVMLRNHGLHLEIRVDPEGSVGAADPAGVSDIWLESALTTIMDLEDAVSAVDASDKVAAYRNWQGLMDGTLQATVRKGDEQFTRVLASDRAILTPQGEDAALPGRAVQFVRHVGHAMFSEAVLDGGGAEIPEGLLDALITVAAAVPGIRGEVAPANSRSGSIYVVKPKMHGPDEVRLTVEMFAAVEALFGLQEGTVKIGIMDEERRTTVNLAACIAAASDRVVFINTGFLDRTGDEIHSTSLAGPMARKPDLRTQPFLGAYERNNVLAGLRSGFAGRAQIGKGMWAMTDRMHQMLDEKIAHPRAGASTAWVPSPTAATLHATHYHRVDVATVQRDLLADADPDPTALFEPPVADGPAWTDEQRLAELDDNVQSILGYVVRWVHQGIGCSKVPDRSDVALMEDRATLRISSQLLGNWLTHGVISQTEVIDSLDRIAPSVDAQNAGDPLYRPLGSSQHPTPAYRAARELILEAPHSANGYTERTLHAYRRAVKAAQ